jgi:hypothetical protein
MKFAAVIKRNQGLYIELQNEAGAYAGAIVSCYVSSCTGPFVANVTNGRLFVTASVLDRIAGTEHCVAEFRSDEFSTREAADKAVRAWIRLKNVRALLMAAAIVRENAVSLACPLR